MIDVLGFVDKIFSALSITKSASDLHDELDQADSQTNSKNRDKQEREEIARQRLEAMRSEREHKAVDENDDKYRQKR